MKDAAILLRRYHTQVVRLVNRQFFKRPPGVQAIPYEIALESGFVSVDNLRAYADKLGWVPVHPNSWGCVFRGHHWRCIGRQQSALPSNHGRYISIWEWRP